MSSEDKNLVNISIAQPKQSTLANSKAIESKTLDESPETSEMSSSDQIASQDTSAAEASDSASNSASDSRSSDDSDSSTDDEDTTSDTDEETNGEQTDSSTDTEKISGDDAQPSKLLSAAFPNVGSSETISPAFVKQSETAFMSSTPNGDHTYTQDHGVSQVENWDDLKSIGKRRVSESGIDSTQSESSRSDLSVFGSSIPTKTKNPFHATDYGKSITVQNTVDATAKFDVKSDSTSHTKSDSDKSCIPPELAGGWGEEPGPAPWDWQAMPFDYMGILEEQRRTVFYEFHEHNGKGEWIDPKYKHSKSGYGKRKDDFEKNLIRDDAAKIRPGRRAYSGEDEEHRNRSRDWYSHHADCDQDESDECIGTASGRTRGRGRGRGKLSRGNYKRGEYKYRNKYGITSIYLN